MRRDRGIYFGQLGAARGRESSIYSVAMMARTDRSLKSGLDGLVELALRPWGRPLVGVERDANPERLVELHPSFPIPGPNHVCLVRCAPERVDALIDEVRQLFAVRGLSCMWIPSVHDSEMRHCRKSPTKRFDGHKLGIAIDTDGQLITPVDVMAGGAKDNEDALELVQASEAATAVKVQMAMGDAACSGTRREFLNANKKFVARFPATAKTCSTSPKTASRSI